MRTILFLGLLLMPLGLFAALNSQSVVEAQVVSATDGVHPGTSAKLAIVAQIAPGFHINDHKPTLEYLIPTAVKLDPARDITLENTIYPAGVPVKFAFSEQPLSVYEGTLVVGAELKVAKNLPQGSYTIKGKLSYQACNDHACLPPASVPLSLTIRVVASNVPLKRLNADVFDKLKFN
jgi:DsbC/DsbD-like thiol-disulfide interchange protein